MTDVQETVEQLQDLLKQATTERSHFYTASVICKALQVITELREDLLVAHKKMRTDKIS